MTIYGYTRVSTEQQIGNTSIESQRSMIEGTAKASGLSDENIVWLDDLGVSGARDFVTRPAVAPIVFRNGDVIIFSALDRFSRDPRDTLNTVHEMKQRKVSLVINGHGDVTSSTNIYGKLILEIMAVISGYERDMIAERTQRGSRAKAAKGGYIGGAVPFGMKVEGEGQDSMLVKDEELHAKINDFNWKKGTAVNYLISRMAGQRKSGDSCRAISAWVKKRYDIDLSHVTVTRLTNAFEKTNLTEAARKGKKRRRLIKSQIRQAAAVKLGLNPKRFA